MDISSEGVGGATAAVGLSVLFKMRQFYRKTPINNHPPDDAEIQAEKIVSSIQPKARVDQYLQSTMRKSKPLLPTLAPPSTKIVRVNFKQCLSQGLMSTLMVSGPRLHQAKTS